MFRSSSSLRVAGAECVSRGSSNFVNQTSMPVKPASAKAATSSANVPGMVVASLMQGFILLCRITLTLEHQFDAFQDLIDLLRAFKADDHGVDAAQPEHKAQRV